MKMLQRLEYCFLYGASWFFFLLGLIPRMLVRLFGLILIGRVLHFSFYGSEYSADFEKFYPAVVVGIVLIVMILEIGSFYQLQKINNKNERNT